MSTPQRKSVEQHALAVHLKLPTSDFVIQSMNELLAEREAELVRRVMETKRDIKTAVDVAADPSEWSSTMIVHNTAIDQALTIIKEVFKKQS